MNMAQILLLVLAVPAAYLLLFLLLRLENRLPASAAEGNAGASRPEISGGARAGASTPRQ